MKSLNISEHQKEKKKTPLRFSRYLVLFILFGSSLVFILGLMTKSPMTRLKADGISYGAALLFVLLFSYGIAIFLGRTKKEKKLLIFLLLLTLFVRILGSAAVTYFEMGDEGYLLGNAGKYDRKAWDNTFLKTKISDITYGFPATVIFYTLCYKTFSPDAHRPLIPLIILALVSGLTAVFVYKSARKFWGKKTGILAGFIAAITPEFAFHSWTHLREPVLSMGLSIVLFGLALIHRNKDNKGLWVGFLGTFIVLIFHPGFGAGALVIFLAALVFMRKQMAKKITILVCLLGLSFLIGMNFAAKGLWISISAENVFTGKYVLKKIIHVFETEGEKPFDALSRSILLKLPTPVSIPASIVYSVTLPYLPIGFYWTAWSFKIPLTLRAIGWQIVLPFLLLGIYFGLIWRKKDRILFTLSLAAIFIISITAAMNRGELWDSTRYRSFGYPLFACLIAYSMVKGWQRPKLFFVVIFLSQAFNMGLIFFYKMTGSGDLPATVLESVGLALFFYAWHKTLQVIKENRPHNIHIYFQSNLVLLFGIGVFTLMMFFIKEIIGIGESLFFSLFFSLLLPPLFILFLRGRKLRSFQ